MRIHHDAAVGAELSVCRGGELIYVVFSSVDEKLKEMYLFPSYIHLFLNSQQFHLDKTAIACVGFIRQTGSNRS